MYLELTQLWDLIQKMPKYPATETISTRCSSLCSEVNACLFDIALEYLLQLIGLDDAEPIFTNLCTPSIIEIINEVEGYIQVCGDLPTFNTIQEFHDWSYEQFSE